MTQGTLRVRVAALATILALVAAACGGGGAEDTTTTSPPTTSEASTTTTLSGGDLDTPPEGRLHQLVGPVGTRIDNFELEDISPAPDPDELAMEGGVDALLLTYGTTDGESVYVAMVLYSSVSQSEKAWLESAEIQEYGWEMVRDGDFWFGDADPVGRYAIFHSGDGREQVNWYNRELFVIALSWVGHAETFFNSAPF